MTWLFWEADVLPVTSIHDFFGASVVQAIYCNCKALLPNRLAYPEHLEKTTDSFYNTEEELKSKLRNIINGHPNYTASENKIVKQYDWSIMASVYDKTFEALTLGQ